MVRCPVPMRPFAIAAAACVTLGCLAALALIRQAEPPAPSIRGTVGAAEGAAPDAAEPAEPAETFSGLVIARETVDLAARLDGVVRQVRVRLGDRVARDAVVATLDARPRRHDLSVGQAALEAARAEE